MRIILLLALPILSLGHKEPHTPEEIEVQRNLQIAAYHCAPAVAAFTAARQRSWAQKVLSGRPSLPGYDDLFAEGTYADIAPGKEQHLLSCSLVEDTKIENNTCVLSAFYA